MTEKNAAPLIEASTDRSALPEAIYVWLVPSEHMLDQPGSWRIRKWDTEPFPEATHVAAAPQEAPSEAVDETAIQEARIWRVCAVLRPEGCNRCPTEVQTSSYGTGAKACRLIAEKACEAAGTGYVALPKPQGYCILNKDGKMFWEEGCISTSPGDLIGTHLEFLQDDHPDDGWHIAPFFAEPVKGDASQNGQSK